MTFLSHQCMKFLGKTPKSSISEISGPCLRDLRQTASATDGGGFIIIGFLDGETYSPFTRQHSAETCSLVSFLPFLSFRDVALSFALNLTFSIYVIMANWVVSDDERSPLLSRNLSERSASESGSYKSFPILPADVEAPNALEPLPASHGISLWRGGLIVLSLAALIFLQGTAIA